MKKQYTNNDIKKELKNNNHVFLFLISLLLFSIGFLVLFLDNISITIIIAIYGIVLITLVVCLIYRTQLYRNDKNWYITKEVITNVRDVGDSDGSDLRVVLFDNQLVKARGINCGYGDNIFVIRAKKNNKPLYMFLEDEMDYQGDKEIVDYTNMYGKEYYFEKRVGNKIPVNEETHTTSPDGTKFLVTANTKKDAENREKMNRVLRPIFIILIIAVAIYYFVDRQNMRDNWIYTTATIEDREFIDEGEDYVYKYYLVYKIDGVVYHSNIKTKRGKSSDVGYDIRVYVNPKNYEEVRIDRWKVIK